MDVLRFSPLAATAPRAENIFFFNFLEEVYAAVKIYFDEGLV